jgi:hypothetical protein
VIGYYRQKIIEFYTYKQNKNTEYGPNYIIAQAILPISYNDILVKRKKLFNFSPRGLRRNYLESNDFNRRFCLWATPQDQVNSFRLLSPTFMEKIYHLPFELNIEMVGHFLYLYNSGRSNVNYQQMLEVLSWAFDEMKM